MFKLKTTLTHFRFTTSKVINTPHTIEWYKLEENEDNSESYGICLQEQDVQKLTAYMNSNSVNFGSIEKSSCDNEDISIPRCGNEDLRPIKASHPKNIVLRRKPLMAHKESIFACMDIELLNDKGESDHHYDLPFDIVGKMSY